MGDVVSRPSQTFITKLDQKASSVALSGDDLPEIELSSARYRGKTIQMVDRSLKNTDCNTRISRRRLSVNQYC
jgi:hypothetical protein